MARLRSVSGEGAAAWLQAVPMIDELALNTCEFRIAVCLRLVLPLPFYQWITTCDCKASLDHLGFHLLICNKGGGLVWVHDSVVAGWSSCLRELDIHHKKEQRNSYLKNSDRSDIAIFDSSSACNLEVDISLVHPWAKDILKGSSRQRGHAARKREEEKDLKYAKELLPSGQAPKVIPLVFEHFGNWGVKASSYLDDLSKRASDLLGQSNPGQFKTYWRRRFSVLLQKCNAKVILKKLSSLSSCTKSVSVDLHELQFAIH